MATGIRKKETRKKAVGAKAKTPKKATAKKLSGDTPLAAKPESTTALARVEGTDITEVHSKAVVREAQRLDDKIVKTIDRMGKDFVVLGEMFQEMQDKGYHRALINPETGKAFGQFKDYLAARYPDQSRTQVFQAMRIVRELTAGPNPAVSRDDVREMSRDNAEGLAKLKSAGREITPELITQAKTLAVHEFKSEVLGRNELEMDPRSTGSRKTDLQPEILVKRTFWVSGLTSANLDKSIEIIKFLGEGLERDKGQGLDDYIIGALTGDFLSAYAKDYEEMKRIDEAKAVHAVTMTEDAAGPERADEAEAEAAAVEGLVEEVLEEVTAADDQKTETAQAFDAAIVPDCIGKTKAGKQCKSPAVAGSEYCFNHRDQQPEPSERSVVLDEGATEGAYTE